jgi:anti-anti-sigma factor
MFVDQDGPNFTVTTAVTGGRVDVTVSGEVDMATADDLFHAASKDGTAAATLDLRAVTFFDSAAIHAVLRLAEHYGGGLRVLPSPQVRGVLVIWGLAGQPWLAG